MFIHSHIGATKWKVFQNTEILKTNYLWGSTLGILHVINQMKTLMDRDTSILSVED